jgi:hypothetical protein
MTIIAGRELRPFSEPAAAGASEAPAGTPATAVTGVDARTFGSRTFFSRGTFSRGTRGGFTALPGFVAGPAEAAVSEAGVGCDREKKLGSEGARRTTGGVRIGASVGAVGAVATDCG